MKVICIIPARGGSKGLPRKNIKPLFGHPLISWPIAAAQKSTLIDKIVVSTDDQEIADIAVQYGAETPFLRGEDVSGDLATTEETLKFSLSKAEEAYNTEFDIALFLTCTDIFRRAEWVDEAILALKNDPELESAFAVNSTHKNYWQKDESFPPERMAGWMKVYSNRQVRKPIYREDTGLCCASRAHLWRDGRRIGDNVRLIVDNRSECSIDVHSEFDIYLAERAMEWMTKHCPENMPPIPRVSV